MTNWTGRNIARDTQRLAAITMAINDNIKNWVAASRDAGGESRQALGKVDRLTDLGGPARRPVES